jgi:hypothetical protein
MLEQVVDRNHVGTTEPARNPVQVWDVNDIAIQPPHNRPEIEAAFERVVGLFQRHGVEVRRERSAFRHTVRRTDEEILAVAVQAGEGTDYIPDVRANPKFRHATDVDGDLHSLDLTTGARRDTGNSPFKLVVRSEAKDLFLLASISMSARFHSPA